MKKIISVVVILLFIGLAFAPSINANVGKEELVEFTTEICGLNGGKQTVKLTQQQADEVEALFNTIREQLNVTESREETEEIFKDAVVELDKYGLLGGLSVKQAQKLVTGGYYTPRILKLIERRFSNYQDGLENVNFLCLLSGRTTYTVFVPFPGMLLNRISGLLMFFNYDVGLFLLFLIFIFYLISLPGASRIFNPIPVAIGNGVCFGCYFPDPPKPGIYKEAEGWLNSYGILGKKSWEKIEGQIGDFLLFSLGATGFTGLKLTKFNESYKSRYLGFALYLNVD
jgi:hypothetical protein